MRKKKERNEPKKAKRKTVVDFRRHAENALAKVGERFFIQDSPEYAPASAEKVLKPIAASGAEHDCEQAN